MREAHDCNPSGYHARAKPLIKREALDQARSACMVPYAQLKLVKTEGFKSILLFFKIFDFNKPSGNNQGHLKSSILTAVKIEDFKCALF
jgi:hypothetical protein